MPLNIRSESVNQLAQKLAARARMRMALESERQRPDEAVPPRERLRQLQDRVLSWRLRGRITSPIAIFEAALGICRKRHASVEEAEADVHEFLGVAAIRAISITEREAGTALAAFSRYGKGEGHPA